MTPGWYLRRLGRMSPPEMWWRCVSTGRRWLWRSQIGATDVERAILPGRLTAPLRSLESVPRPAGAAADAAIEAADRIMSGHWRVLAAEMQSTGAEIDWFTDPLTGKRAPDRDYCFAVPYRDESCVGNIKHLWEPSRHQHVTLLGAAYWLTGETRYAERAAAHLQSWWRQNPFLRGVHWTSAIEGGIRLLSWSWTRVLLAGWGGVGDLFDGNRLFHLQLYNHQRYVAAFRSYGSSANNHLIAEMAGLAAASAAFPWFRHSAAWATIAWEELAAQLVLQTHADGLNREQASDYHGFVFDLGLGAAIIGCLAGRSIDDRIWRTLIRMADAAAATLDSAGRAPRMGDGDDGRGILLDAPEQNRWMTMLEAVERLGGAAPWWPGTHPSGSILAAIVSATTRDVPPKRPPTSQLLQRPNLFADAGQAFLRTLPVDPGEEIWCRCDHGPHGFLSIAAHGHADALSIELRVGGIEVLVDPGTYCYHGDAEFRRYFRSTLGHNTLTLDGEDQARQAGPFLWLDAPRSALVATAGLGGGRLATWQAWHDGYRRLRDPVRHFRSVTLDRATRVMEVADWTAARDPHRVQLAFHLGPEIACALLENSAVLRWQRLGEAREAALTLPPELDWRMHRGEMNPPLGWYSTRFGARVPSTTLIGSGSLKPNQRLLSRISLHCDADHSALVREPQLREMIG